MSGRFYITRHPRSEPMQEIWCSKTRSWQWFYNADVSTYSSIGRAERVVDQLERDGVIKFNTIDASGVTCYDNVEIVRTDIFAKNREARVY
jgi:hypothetical protein